MCVSPALLNRLLEVYRASTANEFAGATLRVFDELFPGSLISFDHLPVGGGKYAVRLNREIVNFPATAAAVARCVARDNPLVAFFAAQPEPPGGVAIERLSDHIAPERFWETELYRIGFAPFGVAYQLAVFLRKDDGFIGLGVNRAQDFSAEEVELARACAAHVRQALDARLWFNARLLAVPHHGAEERALTKRELEVRRWLAEGKRNAEIATILGCKPGTVKKHCENIYRKLGVETRTAAGLV